MLFNHAQERLIERLKIRGIHHPAILKAMRHVPRHLFIDEALESHAYTDHALPIGYGQTISQPYIVALMTESLLNHGKMERVLEIGTGCGYQTAVLAEVAKTVYTVERIRYLAEKAQERLLQMNYHNVAFRYSDGHWGWEEYAPFDGILVTAAPESVPDELLTQLAIGGCMIIPVGEQRGQQRLLKIVRTRSRFEQSVLEEVSFVPLRGGIS